MLAVLLLALLIVLVAAVLGQGALTVCGCEGPRWWSPGLGLAALLVIGGQVIRLPGHATTAVLIAVIMTLGSLVLPGTRRGLRAAPRGAIPLAAGVLLLAAIPLFASGSVSPYGVSVSNDMSQHLAGAWFIRNHEGLRPVAAIGGTLVGTGYPLGGHGIVAMIAAGTGEGEIGGFDALTLAVPVLLAFTALGALPRAPARARWVVAAVIGLGYLPTAYLAQGQFKETIQALLLFTGAVLLGDLVRVRPRNAWHAFRLGAPYGLLVAGGVYNYSYGALLWMVGAAAFVAFLEFLRAHRRRLAAIRAGILPALGIAAATVIAAGPEVNRMVKFANSIFGVEPKKNHGNLPHAVNPFETLGVWLSGDFRRSTTPFWPTVALQVLAGLALVAGLVWWWRRRRIAVPGTAVVAIVVWIELALTRNIYNAAKGLIVAAPLVALSIAAPLLAAFAGERRAARLPVIPAARLIGVVLLVGASLSSLLVLRSTVASLGQQSEFAKLRQAIGIENVLFLGDDHFTQWNLHGTTVYSTDALYAPRYLRQRLLKRGGTTVDVDNYSAADLDEMRWLITTNAPFQSAVPPNFRPTLRTRSFVLYRREGPTPDRVPAEGLSVPYGRLDCASALVREQLATHPRARVVPAPIMGPRWRGSISKPGHAATLRVALPRGRWDLSLQYLSATGAEVSAPGLRAQLPVYLGRPSPYWFAGTLTSPGGGVTVTIRSLPRSWFGQLLGPTGGIHVAGTPFDEPLRFIAFTRHGATGRLVPSAQACGRWVDWLIGAS